jgi:hypothetical protein
MIILNGIKIQFLNFIILLSKILFSVLAGLILGFGLSFIPSFNEFLITVKMDTYVFSVFFMLIVSFFIKYTSSAKTKE